MQALVTKDEMLRVPFSRMRLDPDNERIDLGPMEWLISSIRSEGIKEAMWGYRGKDQLGKECYFVVNGRRRFAALELVYDGGAGIDIVAPFKAFNPDKVNKEQRIIERLIRNEGLPYSRLEKSASIGKLSAYGWSNQKIASQLSMSVTWVADTLILHNAPQRLKNIIITKELSASLAIEMIKKGEVEAFLTDYAESHPAVSGSLENAADGNKSSEPNDLVKKITRKDRVKINSSKEFKQFSKGVDPGALPTGKGAYFIFLSKLMNNELTKQQIADFFLQV